MRAELPRMFARRIRPRRNVYYTYADLQAALHTMHVIIAKLCARMSPARQICEERAGPKAFVLLNRAIMYSRLCGEDSKSERHISSARRPVRTSTSQKRIGSTKDASNESLWPKVGSPHASTIHIARCRTECEGLRVECGPKVRLGDRAEFGVIFVTRNAMGNPVSTRDSPCHPILYCIPGGMYKAARPYTWVIMNARCSRLSARANTQANRRARHPLT
jgi:hypothetical protein